MITVRNAEIRDIRDIMALYETARAFMRNRGNPTQWNGGYPDEALIRQDIAQGQCYVCLEQGKIVGVFAFILGEDATYRVIEQGSWHYDFPYGTIHRLASAGITGGISKTCFDFCLGKSRYLRIDTHADNQPMQAAIVRYGFQPCGVIHVADGSPRLAFDYCAE